MSDLTDRARTITAARAQAAVDRLTTGEAAAVAAIVHAAADRAGNTHWHGLADRVADAGAEPTPEPTPGAEGRTQPQEATNA